MNKIASFLAFTTPIFLVACGGGSSESPMPTISVPTMPTPTAPPPTTTPTTPSGPKNQTISVLALYPLEAESNEILFTTATSGLPVIYTSTTPSICSISGVTLTGVAVGTCTVVVSQSGNADFSAAPSGTYTTQVTRALLAQTISPFSIPALSVSTKVIVSPSSTSGLPITIMSLTPDVCSTQNRVVVGITVGTCKLQASQNGTGYYANSVNVYASVAVGAANSSLGTNAVLGSWMTTPESGSITLDSSTILEGIYTNTVGAQAFIDGANNFIYSDPIGLLSGVIQLTAATWAMSSSSVYYTSPNASLSATASGSFISKQSLTASALSFTSDIAHFDLTYDPSNGYAASQSDVSRMWIFDNGQQRIVVNIDSLGKITGTFTDLNDSICNLDGHILQTESASQHNMYKVTLNASGTSCTHLQTTEPYTGLAVIHFSTAGAVTSNGYIPILSGSLIAPTTKTRFKLLLY